MLVKSLLVAALVGALAAVVTAHETPSAVVLPAPTLPDTPAPLEAPASSQPVVSPNGSGDGCTVLLGQLSPQRLQGEQIQMTMSRGKSWSLELTGKAALEHGDMRVKAEHIRVLCGKDGKISFHFDGNAQYCDEQWRAEGETIDLGPGEEMRIQGAEGHPARFQQLKDGKAITEVEGTVLELHLPEMEITGAVRVGFRPGGAGVAGTP